MSDDYESENDTGKDETELELERRVFGDSAGFVNGLSLYQTGKAALSLESEDQAFLGEEPDLANVDDADVNVPSIGGTDLHFTDTAVAFFLRLQRIYSTTTEPCPT